MDTTDNPRRIRKLSTLDVDVVLEETPTSVDVDAKDRNRARSLCDRIRPITRSVGISQTIAASIERESEELVR